MTEQTAQVLDPATTPTFRGSLVRTVVIGLLIVSLVPVLVIGFASYLQIRQFMLDQAATQIQSLSENYNNQLSSLASSRQNALTELNSQANFDQDVLTIFQGSSAPGYNSALRKITDYLNSYITTPTEDIFSLLAIVDSGGNVIASSNSSLVGKPLTDEFAIISIYQTDQNILMLNPGGLFPNKLVLITTKLYQNPLGGPGLTFVGFSSPALFTDMLRSADSLFPSTHAFFITTNKQYARYNPVQQSVAQETFTQSYQDILAANAPTGTSSKNTAYTAQNDIPVRANLIRIRDINSTLVIEVPESSIFGRLQSLLPFILILLTGSLLFTSVIIGFGARRIVVPLVDLARHARDFTSGDWSYRANVNRNDEIGLLGYSFNMMVQQLTELYRSLETRVEERTRQMRTATEAAQEAVSAPSRVEILQRSTNLLSEKFNFALASIYLVDETGQNAVLTEQSSPSPENKLADLAHIPVNDDTLIGWVAKNGQSRLEENIPSAKSAQQLTYLLPQTLSEIAVPITLADSVVGVLDIQSADPAVFDSESVSIFNAFAGQIAAGLRNIQTVESSATSIQQAAVFSRFVKLISSAKTRDEVISRITELFAQTNFVSFFMDVSQDQLQLATLSDPKGTRLDQSLKGFTIPFGKGIARLSEGSPIFIENLDAESEFAGLNSYFSRRGCKSAALIPVMEGGILSHVIALGSREKNHISAPQIQPMLPVAESIASTLEKLKLESELQKRERALSTLDALGKETSSEPDLNNFALRLHDLLNKAMSGSIGMTLATLRSEDGMLDVLYYSDPDLVTIGPYLPSNDLLSQIITSGEPLQVDEVSTLGLRTVNAGSLSLTTQSFLGVPLKVGDQVIGVLALLDHQNPRRFREADLHLLTTIAPQIAGNLQNAKLLSGQIKALEAYDQEHFLFNSLLDHTPDRIEFMNRNGVITRNSQASLNFLSEINPNIVSDSSATDSAVSSAADLALMESGESVLGEIEKHTHADGNETWELVSKTPLRDSDGNITGLLIIGRDITDLKIVQQLAEHRANQLLTASEIARDTSSGSQDIDELLKRMVQLVRERFGFYHASIFLLDPLGQFAVLKESTGEAGEVMKQRGHKLAVGSQSIIGQTTLSGQPVIVNDVSREANYFPNPLLPETRSELGIPLINTGQVIGALDVQSVNLNAFSDDDVRILQVMGDQLAVAIQNAELFTRTESSLNRHRLLHQITAAAGKSSTIDDAIRSAVETLHLTMSKDQITFWTPMKNATLVVKAYAGLPSLDLAATVLNIGERAVGMAALEKRILRVLEPSAGGENQPVNPESQSIVCVPVIYQDRLMGVINVENIEPAAYDETDQEIITTLANNLASIIANIELVDQVRSQVDRQQQLYEITSKIRRSVDVETILQTSVSEIANVLNLKHASIEITAGQSNPAEVSQNPSAQPAIQEGS